MKKLLFSMALACCATFSLPSESKASTADCAAPAIAPKVEMAQAVVETPRVKFIVLDDGTLAVCYLYNGKWYVVAIM